MKGFFVTATDTGIGKTLFTGGLAGALRKRGYQAGVYKPVQSGHLAHHLEGDAARLRILSGVSDPPERICPYALEEPLAPLLALRRAGHHVTLDHLEQRYHDLTSKYEVLLVEGAGGLAVPYVEDGLVADAARRFGLPLIIVARPSLGTINHTLLTIEYAKGNGLEVAGIIISGYREEDAGVAEQTNPALIESYSGIPIWGVIPWIESECSRENVVGIIEQSITWNQINKYIENEERDKHGISR